MSTETGREGGRLKRAFFWTCDKIVTGTVEAFKRLPALDRRLTDWTWRLLTVMARYKWLSLIVLVLVPTFALLFLEADGLFEPISDAFDAVTDVLGTIPFDMLALAVLLGSAAAAAVIKIKRAVTWAEAGRVVLRAVAARVVYLMLILIIVMMLLQATPLKTERRLPAKRVVSGEMILDYTELRNI